MSCWISTVHGPENRYNTLFTNGEVEKIAPKKDMVPSLAVIIPCLNEEDNLRELLPQICSKADVEVIVVDGGSSDGSRVVAEGFDCRVVESPKGRGKQMNRGAGVARSPNLLFLHGDTRLPGNFPYLVRSALQQEDVAGGAFSLATDEDSFGLRLVCGGANLRSRLFKLPYGDQAIFTGRAHFEAIGGYPEMEIMEDYVFVKTLGRRGKIVILEEKAVTSARRWLNVGILRTTLINQLMILGYKFGFAPKKLAQLYRRAKGLGRKGE